MRSRASPEGETARILELGLDGDQALRGFPFDGDTVTHRSVYEVVSLALLLAGKDEPLSSPREDDDDDSSLDTTVALHLLFRAGEEPQLDWRIQGDSVGDGPLRDGHDPALRAQAPATAALFDRFVREVLDPDFVSRPA